MAGGQRSSATPLLPAVCLLVVLAATGCGSEPAADSTRSTGSNRYFGDYPGQEASQAHLSQADCRVLTFLAERETEKPLRIETEPTPPNSRCRALAAGINVSVYLDAAYAARQRYLNRMVEQVQFNAPDRAKIPHNVPGVGDPGAGDQYASWIPAYSILFAVRGNRWVTVAYAVPSQSLSGRRTAAIALARRAFRLSVR